MVNKDAARLHKLWGPVKQRATYKARDLVDYTLMTLITAAILSAVYGPSHPLAIIGLVLSAFMIVAFPLRHGFALEMPVILRRPQDVLLSLVYKLQNIKLPYVLALGALLVENLVIAQTPNLPHHVELMHKIAMGLFYGHLILISLYRTVILVVHLHKRELVREILLQSAWKSNLERQPHIGLQIVHAYVTGLLTHIVYVAPWYFVITHLNFSLVLMPVSVVAAVLIQRQWSRVINDWFYRDHWLGHNAEFEFVYLHGPHHDGIPSGLIGVAGNGHLEGFFRGIMGFPIAFYNPLMALVFYSIDIKIDIDSHQYIPGIYPILPNDFYKVTQHSLHHLGRVEPYSFAIKADQPGVSKEIRKRMRILPPELRNSVGLDEQMTDYKWDNAMHKRYLALIDKYQNEGGLTTATGTEIEEGTT
jgi:hypothetical protein